MSETSFRGGARIGWLNATWPFAKLSVSPNTLTLASRGTYQFKPSEIVALEPHGSVPFFSTGIRIIHNRLDYPNKIIFWCMGNRERVLAATRGAGFLPSGLPSLRPSGFPVRWRFLLGAVALWNALLLLDWHGAKSSLGEPRPLSLLALLLIFAAVTAIRLFPRAQSIVLREGHQVGEIKAILALLQLVSGLILLGSGGFWFAQVYGG